MVESLLLLSLTQCTLLTARDKDRVAFEDSTVLVMNKAPQNTYREVAYAERKVVLGLERLDLVLNSLRFKRVAVVSNHTSMIQGSHLVDTLLRLGIDVKKVFAPEHGFRGTADAGQHVLSTVDEQTGLPIISLYADNKKPTKEQLADIDMVVYDIQDVGVRFYTYISTLHYVMQACAENGKEMYVLDRPNPNGHYVDGPVRKEGFRSFVGMHPVPIVYGMTIGEYALMVNGEGWLGDSLRCNLKIVPCQNYYHKLKYEVPIPPSPNLRSNNAILMYPSLCLFEATAVSVGRGTDKPFEWIGHPSFPESSLQFTPVPMVGARNPLHENRLCQAIDVTAGTRTRSYQINISWLKMAYDMLKDSTTFVTNPAFFNRLAGTDELWEQLQNGWSEKEIRASWKKDLEDFKEIRAKYLIYE